MMMYSFLMFLFGASFLIFIEQVCFWLLFLVMGVLMLGLFFFNMGFTDSVFFPLGMMDLLSFSLIFLSLWISIMMLASSFSVYKSKLSLSLFVFSILVLCLVLVMTFLVSNLILFYFFFEFSLIPTMFIIMGWGYQPERIQAGIYFLFYTLAASLPLLGGVVYIQKTYLVESFFFFPLVSLNFGFELLIMVIFLTAFLVKLPMFFVHLWLPKAHVEAPVSGSMILAGVLLKLGGYGAYRIIPFCLSSVLNYGGYIFGLSIAGMFYVGMLCCRLNDMKALVAYSSVAHMGLVICGLLGFYMWGFSGSLMMMLAHGLASSGLFCSVNMYYERSMSRSFFLNSGLLFFLPLFTFMFFMLCISNIAAPPSLNLASEIFLMGSMMKFNYLMVVLFPIGSYMGAVFTLILFSYSQHGRGYMSLKTLDLGTFREYHLFVMHLVPVNFLVLNMEFFVYNY